MKKSNIQFWEKVLQDEPESFGRWFAEEGRFLKSNIRKNAYVLEVGCGNGRSLLEIASITKNLAGIDHDRDAIRDARTKLKKVGNVQLLLADAIHLPFSKNSFDYVLCMTTFANFYNKKLRALREMKRVLKDDGNIMLSVYSENALKDRLKVYEKVGAKIKRISNKGMVSFDDGEHSEQFSSMELKLIFKKVGLKIDKIKKVKIAYICKLSKI